LPLCLNGNFPIGRREEIGGVRVCRQNKGYWREDFFRRHDPRGREYFWLTGAFVNSEPEATDTDEWALANGYVAVVPVQTDMTDYARLESLRRIIG
ncbi:MAG: 5'/3'-nucleotidase SurE, partial [Alistipes sp.]|nr:5'/3'-nucleotidase SurE [Alistipes sp.]